jgi:hypothetical protein
MATRKVKAQSARQQKASSASTSITNGNGTTAKAALNGTHAVAPTVEQIRQRAYQIYLERGATHGQDLDDWYVAERQLTESHVISS